MSVSSKDISIDCAAYTFLRLVEQYKKMDRLIIAYDFDDTVCPYYSLSCSWAASAIRKAKEYLNAYLIVYTCNQDEERIKHYLDKNKIPYDAINENAPFIHFNKKEGSKLYYNLLLDDKAGLHQALSDLETLIYGVMNGTITKENKND